MEGFLEEADGTDGHSKDFKNFGWGWGEIEKATALEQGIAQIRALDACLC